jgi:hypothetical protein
MQSNVFDWGSFLQSEDEMPAKVDAHGLLF